MPQNGEITEKSPFGRFGMMKRLKQGGKQDFSEIVQNGRNDILIEVFIGMSVPEKLFILCFYAQA